MPRPRYPADLVHTAYHEAGHAVVADWLGLRVGRISIVSDERENTLGHVRHEVERWIAEIDYHVTPYREAKVYRHLMVSLAGPAAVAVHLGRRVWSGAEGDRRSFIDISDYVIGGEEERQALWKWLWIRTRGLLAQPLPRAVTVAVADALLARRRLTRKGFQAVKLDVLDTLIREHRGRVSARRSEQAECSGQQDQETSASG